MTFDWTVVIEIAMFALIAVVVAALLPWLKERVGAEKLNKLWRWVCWAVQAAEQLFGAGMGERKKEYVLEMAAANGWADEITEEEFDALVEAAVLELTPTHAYDKIDEEIDGETAEE